MNIWLIADTHDNHQSIIDWGRPFDHTLRIEKGLKQHVKEGDLFIHLGDVSFYNHEMAHEKYGQIVTNSILCLGNHDKKSIGWHYDRGWGMVCDSFNLTRYGKHIIFTHKPLDVIPDGHINVHGHLHEGLHRNHQLTDDHYLVSMERQQYKPIQLKTLIGM